MKMVVVLSLVVQGIVCESVRGVPKNIDIFQEDDVDDGCCFWIDCTNFAVRSLGDIFMNSSQVGDVTN